MTKEFELIRRYFERSDQLSKTDNTIIESIGDDAAVLRPPAGKDVVVTTDTLIENVHFPADTSPTAIGHKALAVNLSDLAAMGADPKWVTLALTLPNVNENWLSEFAEGFFQLADRHGVTLIGGDTTQSPIMDGPANHPLISITVQALGLVSTGQAIKRSGAQPGEGIYVTGELGDAGLALAGLQGRYVLDDAILRICKRKLDTPSPRVEIGVALIGLASAAIDISDGLLADLGHILSASVCGGRIELEQLPLSEAFLSSIPNKKNGDEMRRDEAAWHLPLTAGDDYELLFTAPLSADKALHQLAKQYDCRITRIGIIEQAEGLRCWLDGETYILPEKAGYAHFNAG